MRRSAKTAGPLPLMIMCLSWLPGQAAAEDRLDRLEQEIKELKEENSGIKKRVNDAGTEGEETRHSLGFLSKLADVSGYADAPRTESNPTNDTVGKSQGALFVERMYVEYHSTTSRDVRAGRFLTPA